MRWSWVRKKRKKVEDCSIDVETGSDWDEFGSDYKAEFLRRRRSWVQQEMTLCTERY